MILIATPLYKPHTIRAIAFDLGYSFVDIAEFIETCYVPDDVAEGVKALETMWLGDMS